MLTRELALGACVLTTAIRIMENFFSAFMLAFARTSRRRYLQIPLALMAIALNSHEVSAFRLFDVSTYSPADFSQYGIMRRDAAPHVVDGVERSLDGGLRYSVEGGSYEAFRDRLHWSEPMPTVAEFKAAIEDAFAAWEAQDPETGLGTDIYFVPDLDTPVVIEPFPNNLKGYFRLNRGAEIDLTSWTFSDNYTIAQAISFGDPDSESVTLTSGVPNYSATVTSGSDIRFRRNFLVEGTSVPWKLTDFKDTLTHEIGHALGLGDVDIETGFGGFLSAFYDDNYDGSSEANALETLTNSFADLIDPLDPDNSSGLSQFDVCTGGIPDDCESSPGVDTADVNLLMETSSPVLLGLQNDEYAGRQFLYPFVRVSCDFDANKQLTVKDIDLLSAEIRNEEPRYWFDIDGNEVVNQDDRTHWVDELNNTYFGDSNLDGEFNTGDLVAVFQAGEYEDGIELNSSWATGDWNGNGDFNTGDLVLAFQDGGFEIGPRIAVNAVPEPSSLLMFGIAILALAFRTVGIGFQPVVGETDKHVESN